MKASEIEKLKSKYPDFFAQFSPDLLDLAFSEETSLKVARFCLENGIEDEEAIEKTAYRVALALLDQIPKENLAKTLEKGVGLSRKKAKKISAKVEERIFSQIPGYQTTRSSFLTKKKTVSSSDSPQKEKIKKTEGDTYREPVD